MTLPLATDYPAMEAKLVAALPEGPQWQYEPKWDGFRCLAFKDGDDVDLRSKAGQPFNRYFPEVVAAMQSLPAKRCVLDGELVVPEGGTLSFDELLMRIHPAASRVQKLAREHPAVYIVFDLLVDANGAALVERTLAERRTALEAFAARAFAERPAFRLSPMTRARADVDRWFASLGAALDGVIAKRVDLPYRPGDRTGMQKFKQMRTADCVVGGFRYGTNSGRRRIAAAGSLRRRRPAPSRRLHVQHSARRSRGADRAAEAARRAARLHRPRARRPQPLEHRAQRRVAAAAELARRGGAL